MLELRSLPEACVQRRQNSLCSTCAARAFSVCGSLGPEDLVQLDAIAERVALRAGDTLVREGDVATNVFNITAGSVRIYKLLPDGRRQITGFLYAGDFVGLTGGETHVFSAEAIEDTALCRFRRSEYHALARQRPTLEHALLERAMHDLDVAQSQMLLLGRKTAQERVATFLMDLPTRDPIRPSADRVVNLPMTRSEIADYLGLTIETVSRELTKLRKSGLVTILSAHVLRVDHPDRLRAMAEGG